MKKSMIFVFILLVCFVSSCSPSPEAIQKAIEQTQTAMPAPTLAPTATQMPTPTQRPAVHIPTATPFPTEKYVIEYGFCIMGVSIGNSDPANVPGCGSTEREQVDLDAYHEIHVTFNRDVNTRQWYCALYDLDGNFIMADLDTTASGEAACHLP